MQKEFIRKMVAWATMLDKYALLAKVLI